MKTETTTTRASQLRKADLNGRAVYCPSTGAVVSHITRISDFVVRRSIVAGQRHIQLTGTGIAPSLTDRRTAAHPVTVSMPASTPVEVISLEAAAHLIEEEVDARLSAGDDWEIVLKERED